MSLIEILILTLIPIINITLGLLVIARNPKNRINLTFFTLTLTFGLWGVFLLLYKYPYISSSETWIKATFLFASIFIVLMCIFSFMYPISLSSKSFPIAIILSILYLIGVIWLLYFTNNWVVAVEEGENGLQTILGSYYPWWALVSWGFGFWALANFIRKSRLLKGVYKVQLQYLFAGFALWGIFVNIPDVIIPLYFHDTRYFAVSAIAGLFISIPVTYTMLKHRLFDIRLLVVRSLTYIILLLGIGAIYAGLLFTFGRLVLLEPFTRKTLFVSTILSLVLAVTFQPLRIFIENLTSKFLYRNHYITEELLKELSRAMVSNISFDKLCKSVIDLFQRTIHPAKVAVFILDKNGALDSVYHDEGKDMEYPKFEDLKVLGDSGNLVIYDELPESNLKEIMRKTNISLVTSFSTKERKMGYMVFGGKISGDIYYSQDIKVFEIFAHEFATALNNVSAYREIEELTKTLEKRVAERTKELKESQERELSKAKELLRLKDDFVFIATHDIRNPVTAIAGYLYLLRRSKTKFSPEIQENFSAIEEASSRLNELVDDLLEVSRSDSGTMKLYIEPVNICSVIKDVLKQKKPELAQKKLELISPKCEEGKVLAQADRARLEEVLENLLSNAIKFNKPEGKVEVGVHQEDNEVVIKVKDTGYGIPKEEQKNIFQKFFKYRGDDTLQVPGTGLGLFIVKMLIDKMQGKIDFESQIGEGTTFNIHLSVSNA